MARPVRIELSGALHHVTSRGDRREEIYDDDEDREQFLETLRQVSKGLPFGTEGINNNPSVLLHPFDTMLLIILEAVFCLLSMLASYMVIERCRIQVKRSSGSWKSWPVRIGAI